MVNNHRLLIDMGASLRLTLLESQGGVLVAKGEFGRADVPTQNKRRYPRNIWEREIRNANEAIQSGKVLGELDHPADGKTSLKRVSHLITHLDLREDGLIYGEAKILRNQWGDQLKSILEANGAVGVSSRGMGSTAPTEDGFEDVQEDYQYMTHDFVADPAVLTSYPKFTTEVRWIEPSKVVQETQKQEQEKIMEKVETKVEQPVVEEKKEEKVLPQSEPTEVKPAEVSVEPPKEEEEVKPVEASPAIDANAEANVKSEASESKVEPIPATAESTDPKVETSSNKIESTEQKAETTSVQESTDKLREQIKHELKNDPEFAAALAVMEDIKKVVRPFVMPEDIEVQLKEKDAEIKKLREDIEKVGAVANRLGAALHIEKALNQEPDMRVFLAGRVFEDVKSADVALTEAKKKVHKRRVVKKKKEMESKRISSKYESQVKEISEKNKKLEEALRQSIKTVRNVGLKLYMEERIRDNPNALQIRKLCEGKTTKEEVDSIVDQHRIAPKTESDYNAIRRRFDKFQSAQLVEEHVKESGVGKSRTTVVEGVEGEMEGLFPGSNLDQVRALL